MIVISVQKNVPQRKIKRLDERSIENGRFDTHTIYTVDTGGFGRGCFGSRCVGFRVCCAYGKRVQSGKSDRWLYYVRCV